MLSKDLFIKATEKYNTFEESVPAYYFRRAFSVARAVRVKITVAVCGFYELYLNGARITRGFLSPYISNTDDYIYGDEYDVSLQAGENVIGVLLGNGLQNNPGGYIWDFDKAPFRSAPMFALAVREGERVLLDSRDGFKVAPSPIRADDYRFGEYYDANFEIDGWNRAGFDDTAWQPALPAKAPDGELRVADIFPIVKERELAPVEIIPCADGYIYDFGMSNTGVCRLTVKGEKGQRIELRHADSLKDGDLNLVQVWFKRKLWERDRHIVHCDTYVCRGEGTEVYVPTFTYHGFRYVKVTGITEAQATKDLLRFLVYHTDLDTRGGFYCSDPIANTLQENTRRSIISNFHHFPTDCPQREKNGWTADAALSAEVTLLNYTPERNWREWLRNICKAQSEAGALPGIVPTGGWGFEWGNGPAWDGVLVYLPYFTYLYRGETAMITDVAQAILKYLRYLRTRCDARGLLAIGLGDWCHVGGIEPKAPLVVTDSIISMDIATKAAALFDAVGMEEEAAFARAEAGAYRAAIRAHLIERETQTVQGACQSSQAMALFYGAFEECEKKTAFERLLGFIHGADDHIDLGVLGGRVIFHVLSRFGYADLAYKMITREDYPSFGNWVKRGATTMWEDFFPERTDSMNHHFWGDISAFFISEVAGIRLNPTGRDVTEVEIAPHFIAALEHASAYHVAPAGKISSAWRREGEDILLTLELPDGMRATLSVEDGCVSENTTIGSGTYRITKGQTR